MPQPTDRDRRARSRVQVGEVGSATLEYVGAIALLSLLVLALTLPMVAAGTSLATKVCQIYTTAAGVGGGGGGSCGAPPGQQTPPTEPPFDPKPVKCKVGEHGEKLSAEVTVLVIKIGQNANLLETRYSNGTVSYTATNGGQLGVVVSAPGGEVKVGGNEAGEKVDLGGDFKVDAGSTWTFANQGEADAMRKQLDDYRWDQTLKASSPAYALWTAIYGGKKPPRLPDQSVVKLDLGAYVGGQAGVSLPWGKKASDPALQPPIPAVTGGSLPTPPKIGFKFGLNSKWTMITDTKKETKTYTSTGEGYGQINGTVGPLKGEYKGLLGSSMSVTRDKNNQLTNVTLVSTTENKGSVSGIGGPADDKGTVTAGRSGVHVTTSSLDVSTPEQRAVAEAWLERQMTDPTAFVDLDQTAYPDKLVPGDAFQNLMFTGATVSDVQYANVIDSAGFAAKIKAGVSIGIDLSSETTDSTATSANYLGAPGSGATTRPQVAFPDCVGR